MQASSHTHFTYQQLPRLKQLKSRDCSEYRRKNSVSSTCQKIYYRNRHIYTTSIYPSM